MSTTAQSLSNERQEAARLNVSVRTLQSWRTKGDGPPFVKLGRSVRYDPRRVDEWLTSRARRNTSDPGPIAA